MITTEHIIYKIENQIKERDFSKNAAVLVPIVRDSSNRLNLLFEIRAATLKWQPGDICFPGGKMDVMDKTIVDTAIRETQEELGVLISSIKIYGELEPFFSTIGLNIHPIVGELTTSEFNFNKDEVSQIFLVPIEWFIKNPPIKATMEVAHKPADNFPFELIPQRAKDWQKRSQHDIYIYHYQDKVIWGLTAQIIQQFLKAVN